MVARWMPLPYIFILTLLIPEYYVQCTMKCGFETDRNTNDLDIQRSASESCGEEDSVSFAGFNITKIPATAIKSKTIKNINLKGNLLERIPSELLDNVPLLECLNVAMNKIPYREIFNFSHSNLKTLIVDYQSNVDHLNMIKSRESDSLKARLPKLEMVRINGINVLDMFPNNIFSQLTTLYLTDNKFRQIGANFFSKLPTSVRHLHLERNSIRTVDNLGNLTSLYLDGNPIESITSTNSDEVYLQIVSLRNCSLNTNTLERNFNIHLNDLEILDLSENRLEGLPEYLLDYSESLRNLLLSRNLLTQIPRINKMKRLEKLSLSYNRIEIVNNLISDTLTVLNLRDNNISEITDSSFKNVPALQELDLSCNKLKYLPVEWASRLKNLKQLDLRYNMFPMITSMSLTPLVCLKNLYIKSNLLHDIDDTQLMPQTCTVYLA